MISDVRHRKFESLFNRSVVSLYNTGGSQFSVLAVVTIERISSKGRAVLGRQQYHHSRQEQQLQQGNAAASSRYKKKSKLYHHEKNNNNKNGE